MNVFEPFGHSGMGSHLNKHTTAWQNGWSPTIALVRYILLDHLSDLQGEQQLKDPKGAFSLVTAKGAQQSVWLFERVQHN